MFFECDDFDVRDRFYQIEERMERLRLILQTLSAEDNERFRDMCVRAYVFHESALDGVAISGDDLNRVFYAESASTLPRSRVLQELRSHRDTVFSFLRKSERLRANDVIYQSDVVRLTEVVDTHLLVCGNTFRKDAGKLRKAIPLHSSYFHDFIDPKLVEPKLTQLCQQTEHPEFRVQHSINQAVLFHYNFMQIFPFMEGSGKVGRLFMNSFLVQGGYQLAVIHSSDRQRYYESLKEGPEAFRELLLDSMESSLDAQLRLATSTAMPKTLSGTGSRVVHFG